MVSVDEVQNVTEATFTIPFSSHMSYRLQPVLYVIVTNMMNPFTKTSLLLCNGDTQVYW